MIWPFNTEAKRQAKREERREELKQAMVGYPLYDPPYKIEERRLTPEKAHENFDYFMSVRLDRLANFRAWMAKIFKVNLTLDRNGVVALTDWLALYGDVMFEARKDLEAYYFYTHPWTGPYVGANVVFDMATFLGEALIAQCPKLYWDEFPFLLPQQATLVARLKRDAGGSGFQRPQITGFRNPFTAWNPFLDTGNHVNTLIQWEEMPHLLKCKRKLTKKEWSYELVTLMNRYDFLILAYSDPDLPPGVAPNAGYDS